MLTPLENERDIVYRCQQGDLKGYRLIYNHFSQPLLRLGLSLLKSQEDAEDAVQATFVRLYLSVGQFQFRSSLGTYLFRIMVNTCMDTLKKRKNFRPQEFAGAESVYLSQDPLRLDLEKGVAALPERMRLCFVLFAVEGCKHSEIAEIMDLSIGTVKAHIFQAKSRLRRLFAEKWSGTGYEL